MAGSFEKCLEDLKSREEITGEQLADALRYYRQEIDSIGTPAPGPNEDFEAVSRVFDKMTTDKLRAKYRTVLKVFVKEQIDRNIENDWDVVSGILHHFGPGEKKTYFDDVFTKRRSIQQRLEAFWSAGIINFGPKGPSLKIDALGLDDMVEELYRLYDVRFGRDTGNAVAKRAAEGLFKAQRWIVQQEMRVGMKIHPRRDFGAPIFHDKKEISKLIKIDEIQDIRGIPLDAARFNEIVARTHLGKTAEEMILEKTIEKQGDKILFTDKGMRILEDAENARAGKEWKDFIRPLLDGRRMYNDDGYTMNGEEIEKLLDDVFRDMTAGEHSVIRGNQMSRMKEKQRRLAFLDATSWKKYNARFGSEDLYNHFTTYFHHTSRDIALHEVLGPDPDEMAAYLFQRAQDAAPKTIESRKLPFLGKQIGMIEKAVRSLTREEMLDLIKNTYRMVAGDMEHSEGGGMIQKASTAFLNTMYSIQLGPVALTQVVDIGTLGFTAKYNGLPITGALIKYFRLLNPQNIADREMAISIGLGAQSYIDHLHSVMRNGEVSGTGITGWMAKQVFNWSYATTMTDAAKWSFGMSLAVRTGQMLDRPFEEVEGVFRDMLLRYGITKREWAVMKMVPRKKMGEAQIFNAMNLSDLRISDIRKLGGEYADFDEIDLERISGKVHGMTIRETEFAVTTPDARIRAFLLRGTDPGSKERFLAQAMTMYKSYMATFTANYFSRFMYRQQGAMSKLAFAGTLIPTLTMMGALVIQAKHIHRARDPEDMTKLDFWKRAFITGGGLPMYAELLSANVSLYGKSPMAELLLGPAEDVYNDIYRLTIGNFQDYNDDKINNLGAELVRMTRRYFPGGTIWYGRTLLDRAVWDRLELMADEGARKNMRKKISTARNEYNQEYFWKPGEALPDGVPDPTAIYGGSR